MAVVIKESQGEQDTFELGRSLGENCNPGEVYVLNGDLGVGKTVFTKGFGAGLGIVEPISSPTFTIMKSYQGRLPLYHFDVYRIGDPDEMYDIGYEDYFYGDGVCLVEWGERIKELIPGEAVTVTIDKEPERGFEYRRITIEQVDGGNGKGAGTRL